MESTSGEFISCLEHGTLRLELYRPDGEDRQTPHDQDEVYIVASGSGRFRLEEEEVAFQTGDFLFVPARATHSFTSFSPDFSTWVIFYGPKEGEQGNLKNRMR